MLCGAKERIEAKQSKNAVRSQIDPSAMTLQQKEHMLAHVGPQCYSSGAVMCVPMKNQCHGAL